MQKTEIKIFNEKTVASIYITLYYVIIRGNNTKP